MKRAILFHPEAQDELGQARMWYELQRAGLGDEFLAAVNNCLERIQEQPQSFPVAVNRIRRATVRKFRVYSIMYELVSADMLYVYSIFHGSRDPKTWVERIS